MCPGRTGPSSVEHGARSRREFFVAGGYGYLIFRTRLSRKPEALAEPQLGAKAPQKPHSFDRNQCKFVRNFERCHFTKKPVAEHYWALIGTVWTTGTRARWSQVQILSARPRKIPSDLGRRGFFVIGPVAAGDHLGTVSAF